MEIKNQDRKWKDALLKTSLPLELLAAEILNRNDIYVGSEYSYLRENEDGKTTEFSVDLNGFKLFEVQENPWLSLNFLIECKYNYPGVKWIFAPYTNNEAIITGVLSTFQEFCTRRIETSPLYELDDDLPYVFKGIELHANGADVNSIERGLSQIRYAIPQKVSSILSTQIYCRHEEDLYIQILCPILLTTADLFVIKSGLDLKTFQGATNLEDVAEKVDCLVYYQSISSNSHLWKYNQEISRKIETKHLEIDARLKAFAKVIKGSGLSTDGVASYFDFQRFFCMPSERILVVTFDVFENTIRKISSLTNKAARSIKQITDLQSIRAESKSPMEDLGKMLRDFTKRGLNGPTAGE